MTCSFRFAPRPRGGFKRQERLARNKKKALVTASEADLRLFFPSLPLFPPSILFTPPTSSPNDPLTQGHRNVLHIDMT